MTFPELEGDLSIFLEQIIAELENNNTLDQRSRDLLLLVTFKLLLSIHQDLRKGIKMTD